MLKIQKSRRLLVAASLMAMSAAHADTIILDPVTYRDAAIIEPAIVSDCALPETQRDMLLKAAAAQGLVSDDGATNNGGKKHLKVEITNAVASGNAFIGHHKLVQLRATLLDGDTEVGSFTSSRTSMGGFAAGFKSSCAVLHRCNQSLAKDVAGWLKNPIANASQGK